MTDASRLQLGGAAILALALALMLAPFQPLPLPIELRWLAAYLLYIVLPGWLLVRLVLPAQPGVLLERAILALAAGYSLAVLLGLTLHTLFRPIAPWQIAAGGALLVAGLTAVSWKRETLTPALSQREREILPPLPLGDGWGEGAPLGCGEGAPIGPAKGARQGRGESLLKSLRQSWPVPLLLIVAGVLRLADLGWSEFQGDEARVVLRAIAALQGADGALAAHRKVPGEILVAYLFAGSLGQIVESVARLPYAISGVGAVLAFYTLARRLLGGPAAWQPASCWPSTATLSRSGASSSTTASRSSWGWPA